MKELSEGVGTLEKTPQKKLLKSIREKCLDCCVQQHAEVRNCPCIRCPLWPYRMGKNPNHKRNMTEKQKKEATGRLPSK